MWDAKLLWWNDCRLLLKSTGIQKGTKAKRTPVQARGGPGVWGSQHFQSAHEGAKTVSPTHRPPLLPREDNWYSFLLQAGSIKKIPVTSFTSSVLTALSWHNTNKHAPGGIGNWTCDLSTCSAVPRPTAPVRTPTHIVKHGFMWRIPTSTWMHRSFLC